MTVPTFMLPPASPAATPLEDQADQLVTQWEAIKAGLADADLVPDGTLGLFGISLSGIVKTLGGVVKTAVNVASNAIGVGTIFKSGSGAMSAQQWKPTIDSWYDAAMAGDSQAAAMLATYDFGDSTANAYRKVKNVEFEARKAAGRLGVGLIGQSNIPTSFAQIASSPWIWLAVGAGALLLMRRRR